MNSKMTICVLCAVAVAAPTITRADEAPTEPTEATATTPAAAPAEPSNYKQMYEEQKKRNDELEKRISLLEEKDKSEPYVKSEDVPENTLKFLKEIDISGFLTGSYNYNFNRPPDSINVGQGYEYNANQFMYNSFTLILQKAVDYNAFDWQAGFYTELILGQDATFTQASGLSLGDQGDLEQAYIQVNAPLGNGVMIIFGKYVTPIGYEVVETALNANWTPGYQWTLLEPFTHTGLQLGYKLSDEWEFNVYVNNGWDNVTDNNHSLSYIGRIYYTPNDNTSVTLIGYGGPEQTADNVDPGNGEPGADGHWREGVDFVVTHQCTPKLGTAVQVDYGHETQAAVVGADVNGDPIISGDAQWWGIGGWLTYDFTEKVQGAFRADYVNDINGARSSEAPFTAPFPTNRGQELYSLTLTLNYKPVDGLRIAPEFRFDRSTLDDAFGNNNDTQIMTTIGAAYSF
jgi:hypothetical protein